MIIFYKLDTKEIIRGECDTMVPILPMNMSLEEKIEYFKSINEGFVVYKEELSAKIFNYNLVFDEEGTFIGLHLKEVKSEENTN